MAARHLNIDINDEPSTLIENHPLGKLSVLLLKDSGTSIGCRRQTLPQEELETHRDENSGGPFDGITDTFWLSLTNAPRIKKTRSISLARQAIEKAREEPHPPEHQSAKIFQKPARRCMMGVLHWLCESTISICGLQASEQLTADSGRQATETLKALSSLCRYKFLELNSVKDGSFAPQPDLPSSTESTK